jgi:hypothetical protein
MQDGKAWDLERRGWLCHGEFLGLRYRMRKLLICLLFVLSLSMGFINSLFNVCQTDCFPVQPPLG